jgi:predicted nucleic acid-binding protein
VKPKVYIETTVISYLAAWPSRDVVRAGQQQSTREWWQKEASGYDLVTSELVIIEASAGDPIAASERLQIMQALPVLRATEAIKSVADHLMKSGAFPPAAASDALHVALAACNGIDYLATWNLKHLANATLRRKIMKGCEDRGHRCPVICTPEELRV